MIEVKRYDCTSGGAQFCQGCYQMEPVGNGDWVTSEDYDSLKAKLARQDAALDAAQAVVDEPFDDVLDEGHGCAVDILKDTLTSLREEWLGDFNYDINKKVYGDAMDT